MSAEVNFATEIAHVQAPADVEVADLIATVEATGYTAALPKPAGASAPDGDEDGDAAEREPAEVASLRQRVVVSDRADHPGRASWR